MLEEVPQCPRCGGYHPTMLEQAWADEDDPSGDDEYEHKALLDD
jgi:hypothetical protein